MNAASLQTAKDNCTTGDSDRIKSIHAFKKDIATHVAISFLTFYNSRNRRLIGKNHVHVQKDSSDLRRHSSYDAALLIRHLKILLSKAALPTVATVNRGGGFGQYW